MKGVGGEENHQTGTENWKKTGKKDGTYLPTHKIEKHPYKRREEVTENHQKAQLGQMQKRFSNTGEEENGDRKEGGIEECEKQGHLKKKKEKNDK